MTPVLIAILSLIVIGLPVTLALDRNARGPMLIGTAFLYGTGVIFLVLLALSVLHIRWILPAVAVATLLIVVPLFFLRASGGPTSVGRSDRLKPVPHWLDLLSVWALTGYALYATLASLWEWDFWAIWGVKARVFFERGGIDWRFLESSWNTFAHADYPLLLPFNDDFIALLNGAWSDRWLGVLMVAYAAAVLLIVRDMAAQETTPLYAALITATCASIACSRYIGLAEGPLIAFAASAVLFFRRALLFDDHAAWRHAAVLLGLAANVKNEGIALGVSVAIALAILRPKALWRLWPAAALAAPWLLLRAAHVLPTDIVGGPVVPRILARLPFTPEMLALLWSDLRDPWFWSAVVIGIALAQRRRREAFVFIVTLVQLAFYIGTYYATPHDPRWHIVTSWPRLTMQLAMPITVAVLLMLAVWLPANAEARSDH